MTSQGMEEGVHLTSNTIFGGRECHVAETVLQEKHRTFLHDHDFYELFVITEGEVLHLLNGEEHIVQQHTLCFVKPEDLHQFESSRGEEAHFFNIAFLPFILEEACSAASILMQTEIMTDGDFLGEILLPEGLTEIFLRKMKLLSTDPSEVPGEQKHAMLVSLVADCLVWLWGGCETRNRVPRWLKIACEEMNKEENYVMGLDRFVDLSGRSQEHLTRSMRKYYGMKPSEMVNRIRLEAVADKLKSSNATILDIMVSCGYNNVSYFNKVFRTYYGMNPREYRKWNRAVVDPVVLSKH